MGSIASSSSCESLKDAAANTSVGSHHSALYDLPPSYEEAQGIASPHRYCEIDDILNDSCETLESPIYVDIEDLVPTETKPPAETKHQSSNNVYKVEYSFQKRSALEIDLRAGEFVTVLVNHDEAGNPEWWLVENNNGAQGYAPAAYLSQLTVSSDSSQLFS